MTFSWRWRTLAHLLGFLKPFLGWMALSVVLGAATTAAGIGLLGTSAYLLSYAALQPSIGVLQVAIVGVRFFGISRAVFRYLERLVSHSVNFRHLAGLRVWLYRKLEPLAPAVLQEYRSADLLNRAVADIETLENFYVRAVAPPLSALLVIAGVGCFTGRYDVRIAAVLAGLLLIIGTGLPWLAYRLGQEPGRAVTRMRAELHGRLLDGILGMPDLLAYGRQEAQLAEIRLAGRALNQSQWMVGLSGALSNAVMVVLTGAALLVVLLIAIPQVGLKMDGIGLAVLALVTLASFEAVTPLVSAGQHLESSLQSARRLFDLVERQPQVAVTAQPLPAPHSASLQVRNLTFGYPGNLEPDLDSLDFDLPAGKHLAIVGPSGAGKTSIGNLLLRFWDPPSGTILVDGQDIRSYRAEDIRGMVSVIGQPGYLFSATLRQNLLIARPGASEKELDLAIEGARLSELVVMLPQGLDTWIGEHGMQLSGGERQRVVIARALLRDTPFWILDEPTANLDAVTERQILETLLHACQDRSLIYITHRLIGLERMDEILVLDNGRIRERGTHSRLIAAQGIYARWWAIQNSII